MKCPDCGKESLGRVDTGSQFAWFCVCGNEWGHVRAVDPAELLDLIERAINPDHLTTPSSDDDEFVYVGMSCLHGRREALKAIKSYLSGDRRSLEKLAGKE